MDFRNWCWRNKKTVFEEVGFVRLSILSKLLWSYEVKIRDRASAFYQLGINPSQCNHLSHFDPQENGLHFYIGCYHLVGKVSLQTPLEIINSDDAIQISNNLHIGFSKNLEFVPGGFARPVLQLNFEIEVPWVLAEEPS